MDPALRFQQEGCTSSLTEAEVQQDATSTSLLLPRLLPPGATSEQTQKAAAATLTTIEFHQRINQITNCLLNPASRLRLRFFRDTKAKCAEDPGGSQPETPCTSNACPEARAPSKVSPFSVTMFSSLFSPPFFFFFLS